MLDLGGVRDRAEFTRRLAITAALLFTYRLGTFLPLPGIDPESLARLGGVAERISILALGITPYVTILILAELLKVVVPSVRRWEQADPYNGIKLNRIVVGLSLLAAAAQASGLALAIEDVGRLVDEPGTAFRLVCIVALVAGTALAIWLADQITRHGLGSGAWLLLAAGWFAAIPPHIARLLLQYPAEAAVIQLVLGWGLAALVLAATVGLIRAGGHTLATGATCLWSVLLANSVWPWLVLCIALIASGGGLQAAGLWMEPGNPILLLALAVLVAVFAHLYMRSQRDAGSATVSPLPPAVLAGGLAAITFVDMGLATQLPRVLPLAGHLILIAVVALSLLQRWWRPPFEAAAPVTPHDDDA
jgi:preprotein translocase subunit SecY